MSLKSVVTCAEVFTRFTHIHSAYLFRLCTDTAYSLSFETELIFLIDVSKDVTTKEFQAEKEFVKSVAKKMRISQQGPRAAVLAFSGRTLPVVRLGDHANLKDFNSKVDLARRSAGPRRIDTALEDAANLFTERGKPGHRVIVLLTTGNSSNEEGAKKLVDIRKTLEELGVRTYVITLGSKENRSAFRPIVDQSKDIFVTSADSIQHLLYPLSRYIAETKGNLEAL